MGNIIQPFDNNPLSVSVRTGSFTIPAGSYAKIVASAGNGGTFTIDAVQALKTEISSEASNTNLSPGTTTIFTMPTTRHGRVMITAATDNAGGATVMRVVRNGNNAEPDIAVPNSSGADFIEGLEKFLAVGDRIEVFVPSGKTAIGVVSVLYLDGLQEEKSGTFWVPTGAVLDGTGDFRFVVSEYKIAS